MKLMYATWTEPSSLLDAGLRSELASLDATTLQLNLDDCHVADAQLRLSTYDTEPGPVRAVVSVWTDGEVEPVTRCLADRTERLAGWLVEERVPLVPPPVADGARAEALANVAILRRPDGLAVEDWRRIWLEDHTPVAIETQATFGYVQNIVTEALADTGTHTGTDPVAGHERVAALVEELFPPAAMTDFHAFYGSGGDDAELERRMSAMLTSVARFGADRDLEVVPTSRYVFDLRALAAP